MELLNVRYVKEKSSDEKTAETKEDEEKEQNEEPELDLAHKIAILKVPRTFVVTTAKNIIGTFKNTVFYVAGQEYGAKLTYFKDRVEAKFN